MILIAALLTACAAILQAGAVPTLYPGGAAPLLPVAIIAAWAAARHARELWPALLLCAVLLGVTSEGRTGAYLLALLAPTVLALTVQPLLDERRRTVTWLQRLGGSALIGGGGALLYVLVLAVGDGRPRLALTALTAPHALVGGMLWTAGAAGALAVALWPIRARPGGLFS